jgi:hypothetical protein
MDVNNETVLPVRIDRMKEKIEERQRRKVSRRLSIAAEKYIR